MAISMTSNAQLRSAKSSFVWPSTVVLGVLLTLAGFAALAAWRGAFSIEGWKFELLQARSLWFLGIFAVFGHGLASWLWDLADQRMNQHCPRRRRVQEHEKSEQALHGQADLACG